MNSTDKSGNPVRLTYFSLLKIVLTPIGAWPDRVFAERLPMIALIIRRGIPILGVCVVLGQSYFISQHYKEFTFIELGDLFLGVTLATVSAVRSIVPNFEKYDVICQHFFEHVHLMHFRRQGEYYEKVATTLDKISHYTCVIITSILSCAVILFNLTPMYFNFQNGVFDETKVNVTVQFALYYMLPGFDPYDNFWLITILNYVLSYIGTVLVSVYDLLLVFMIFQLIGHIEILKYNLYNFPKPKQKVAMDGNMKDRKNVLDVNMYDKDENRDITTMIKDCADHQRFILNFADEMSSYFGPMIAFNYLFQLSSCCLLLLECTQGDAVAILRYGPLTFMIFSQLITMSVVFEIVGAKLTTRHLCEVAGVDVTKYVRNLTNWPPKVTPIEWSIKSETLKDAVYQLPWECMTISNQRLVYMLLIRSRTPVVVKAFGTVVGVNAMVAIFKTTFSYFIFLRTMDI